MPGGAFAAGDRALLVDAKRRRHLLTLEVGGELHLHTGVVRHDDLIGAPDGSTVRTTLGARLTAVSPTMADYVLEMPRGAQVIYPKDLGPILVLADVFPGATFFCADRIDQNCRVDDPAFPDGDEPCQDHQQENRGDDQEPAGAAHRARRLHGTLFTWTA